MNMWFSQRGPKVLPNIQDFLSSSPLLSIDKECADTNGVVDYKFKLLSEFVEETGLSKEYVKKISGFAFVLNPVIMFTIFVVKFYLSLKKN